MLLDLTRVHQPLTHLSRVFLPAEVAEPDDPYAIAEPVRLELEIRKDKDRYRLVGMAQTVLELPCSRCLEPHWLPVAALIDLRYLPASEMKTDEEWEIQEEDFEVSYYRDDQIDLNELMREQFYLALPMKPLCREECRGLCPQCGINLNVDACECRPRWEDPRLAPLGRLADGTRKS
jgi:uncharacterized protein